MQPLINDERYEVLDGELVVTPAPDSIHQKALFKIYGVSVVAVCKGEKPG